MILVLALIAVVFWGAVFLVALSSQGVAPLDFLLGRLEALPPDLGTWCEAGLDEPSGLVREERFVLPGENAASPYLLHQVRYRDPQTRAIVRVEPELKVTRPRSR
jgi:hypothetical protein